MHATRPPHGNMTLRQTGGGGGGGVQSTLDISKSTLISTTVNPVYNDIRYNSKIRYNVNLVCAKISGSCIFIDIPMLSFRKTYVLYIC